MKRRIIGAILALSLIAVLTIAIFRRSTPPLRTAVGAFSTPHVAESFTPASPEPSTSSRNAITTPAKETEAQRQAAERDLALLAVGGMLRDYRARFGDNPVGTNEEVTRALRGRNSSGSSFESPEAKIENGKLIDRWHHPYFFHQLSRSEMEIRSAGPDGAMWTADDEVLQ